MELKGGQIACMVDRKTGLTIAIGGRIYDELEKKRTTGNPLAVIFDGEMILFSVMLCKNSEGVFIPGYVKEKIVDKYSKEYKKYLKETKYISPPVIKKGEILGMTDDDTGANIILGGELYDDLDNKRKNREPLIAEFIGKSCEFEPVITNDTRDYIVIGYKFIFPLLTDF